MKINHLVIPIIDFIIIFLINEYIYLTFTKLRPVNPKIGLTKSKIKTKNMVLIIY
tara:strand:- start:53138 stop:53302 length:165 start_codon:yes stop_codon:yes gene_type:complete